MKKIMRRYVYTETVNKIMKWGEEMRMMNKIPRSPNNLPNFPYYLEQYLKYLTDESRGQPYGT